MLKLFTCDRTWTSSAGSQAEASSQHMRPWGDEVTGRVYSSPSHVPTTLCKIIQPPSASSQQ